MYTAAAALWQHVLLTIARPPTLMWGPVRLFLCVQAVLVSQFSDTAMDNVPESTRGSIATSLTQSDHEHSQIHMIPSGNTALLTLDGELGGTAGGKEKGRDEEDSGHHTAPADDWSDSVKNGIGRGVVPPVLPRISGGSAAAGTTLAALGTGRRISNGNYLPGSRQSIVGPDLAAAIDFNNPLIDPAEAARRLRDEDDRQAVAEIHNRFSNARRRLSYVPGDAAIAVLQHQRRASDVAQVARRKSLAMDGMPVESTIGADTALLTPQRSDDGVGAEVTSSVRVPFRSSAQAVRLPSTGGSSTAGADALRATTPLDTALAVSAAQLDMESPLHEGEEPHAMTAGDEYVVCHCVGGVVL
jgi:hypothetical protein